MSADEPLELPAGATCSGSQRVDRWLWAARFFKTRSRARQAVRAGKVSVNDARAKPARQVRPGDRVAIQAPVERFVVDVRALNEERRPAPEARALYVETEASRAAREAEARARRERRAHVAFDARRPDRRERHEAIRQRKRHGEP